MKNKKVIIIISIIIAIVLIISGWYFINKTNQKNAEKTLLDFAELINNKDYENMYEKVTYEVKQNVTSENFITRNKNIYEGIGATDIKIEIQNCKKENSKYNIEYKQKMYTSAGEIEFNNTTSVIKENKEYKINWSSNFIFPELGDNDKVRIKTIKAKRGTIIDRYGKTLAEDGQVASVGIVPGKLGDNKE